ncbi:MAG: ankyrin repeat domain-containing protein [Gammaproteobacteria bacterium]|nr:ankyrin repeat domain-containing protein [Gammaproteobacteria bacterium]
MARTINAADRYGNTALISAIEKGHARIVTALLSVPGIEINAASHWGSALAWAATFGSVPIVTAFLNVPGIEINAADQYGDTALIHAAIKGHAPTVTALLSAPGINITKINNDGRTAEQEAVRKGNHDIAALIRARIQELERLRNNLEVRPHIIPQVQLASTFQERLAKIKFKGEIPEDFLCPISKNIMNDPITTAESGIAYDRHELKKWFLQKGNPVKVICLLTRKDIQRSESDNATIVILKNQIERFVKEQEKVAKEIVEGLEIERRHLARLRINLFAPSVQPQQEGHGKVMGASSAAAASNSLVHASSSISKAAQAAAQKAALVAAQIAAATAAAQKAAQAATQRAACAGGAIKKSCTRI